MKVFSLCKPFLLMGVFLISACGSNVFKAAETDDPAADATVAIEKQQSDKAIRILEDALEGDPNNYVYLSLLATAQAQKYGIDLIRVILRMALPEDDEDSSSSTETEGTSGTNEVTFLFDALPDADADALLGLDLAITTMEKIPVGERTEADNFKTTIFYTARVGLRTKQFDKDGDGLVSPVEILDMSDEAALDILESLASAEGALAAGTADNDETAASSEQISAIRAEIDAQEGATISEKLKNYLSNDDSSSSSVDEETVTTGSAI